MKLILCSLYVLFKKKKILRRFLFSYYFVQHGIFLYLLLYLFFFFLPINLWVPKGPKPKVHKLYYSACGTQKWVPHEWSEPFNDLKKKIPSFPDFSQGHSGNYFKITEQFRSFVRDPKVGPPSRLVQFQCTALWYP